MQHSVGLAFARPDWVDDDVGHPRRPLQRDGVRGVSCDMSDLPTDGQGRSGDAGALYPRVIVCQCEGGPPAGGGWPVREDVTPAALQEIRVVEIGASLATAWCGRQFALWGADVVVLEPSAGSPLRRRAPHAPGPDGAASLLWTHVAAGKRSLRQDIACPTAADLERLLAGADVLLADRDDPWLADLGVAAEALQASTPGLVAGREITSGRCRKRAHTTEETRLSRARP
jgi:hypothetical protein